MGGSQALFFKLIFTDLNSEIYIFEYCIKTFLQDAPEHTQLATSMIFFFFSLPLLKLKKANILFIISTREILLGGFRNFKLSFEKKHIFVGCCWLQKFNLPRPRFRKPGRV